jgi:hypothetical protein
MYACPNTGSEFMISIRKRARFWRHAQEKQLRPYAPEVSETQDIVLRSVVRAAGCSDTSCHIEISAYGAAPDNIVRPGSSRSVFPSGMVDGDHFSVVQPADERALSYRVFKAALTEVANQEEDAARDLGDAAAEQKRFVSVNPPWGRMEGTLHGRDDIVVSVLSGTGPRVHVLAGMGGSGKNRLALEIAGRSVKAGRQVWWVSMARINSCMREVANQLRIREGEIEQAWRGPASPPDLVWRALEARQEPWLLVFDNADEPGRLAAVDGTVADGTGWVRPGTAPPRLSPAS